MATDNKENKEPDINACSICAYGPPDWQYKCRDCGSEFEMPAPKGPTEEKRRTCPECNSNSIEVVNIKKAEACPPGG